MGKKKSIYIGQELGEYIRHHEKRESVSGCINILADRYQEIIKRSTPKFSLNEWSLIFDSLNGYMAQGAAILIQGIEWNIQDSITMEKFDEKWNVDASKLLKKLTELNVANRIAIIDSSERWWSAVDGTHTDMDESIKLIVGKFNVLDND